MEHDRVRRAETCRIELWRGYVKGHFLALADEVLVSDPSPDFRCRGGAAAETAASRASYDELVERLGADGWTKTGEGEEWYAAELTRWSSEPVEPVPEPVPVTAKPLPRLAGWRPVAGAGLAGSVVLLAWFLAEGAPRRRAGTVRWRA